MIYTHGYGVVMSEVNRTTDDGLPVLLIQDAPPVVKSKDLTLTRPEIYYGEFTDTAVFVGTDQKEFDYPSGVENVLTTYEGTGGFPISSLLLRLAASVATGDYNIVLTGQMNEESRMMMHRDVRERLRYMASVHPLGAGPLSCHYRRRAARVDRRRLYLVGRKPVFCSR